MKENFLFLELATESDLFTTTAGGTVQLLATIEQQPARDTSLNYDISISDPLVASVLYPSSLVFTPENWNIPQVVYVKGLDNNVSTSYNTSVNGTNTSWVSV